MSKIIGIDLGITNSRAAVMEGGQPVVIPSAEGSRATPSAVFFTKDGQRMVGQAAKRQAVIDPGRAAVSVKRLMGEGCKTTIDGRSYKPQAVSAMILQKLKADAEDYLGEPVTQAVITVPAYFSDSQRQATRDAGRIAGLEVLRIINEPTAAALAYGWNRQEESHKALVYDLGGGFFSVSILEIGDGLYEVLATNGDTHLGGDDFDSRVAGYMADVFQRENGIDLRKDPKAWQRLMDAAEKAKIELSGTAAMVISLPFIAAGPRHLNMTLTRAKFNELTADLVEKTLGCVNAAFKDAGLTSDKIDKVILAGGSTHLPAVRDAVRKLLGKEPCKGVDPDECAVMGAAIQAGVLNGEVKDVLVLDVTPLSLGLETEGHVFTKLIERNTTIPVQQSQVFSTAADNQTSVEIHVLQGEGPKASDNKTLGRFQLTGIPPAPRGKPQIEVTFYIDRNGIVSVTAKDLGTGRELNTSVSAPSGMTEEEIRQCAKEAQRFAQAEKQKRDETEIHSRAESLICEMEKLLRENFGRLSAADQAAVKSEIAAFKKICEGKNASEIKSALDAFTQKVYGIFGKLYRQQKSPPVPESAPGKAPDFVRRPQIPRAEDTPDRVVAFVRQLLPVVDNLERAMAQSSRDEALLAGVKLVHRQLMETLEKQGVTVIDRLGQKFDPNLENAVIRGEAWEGKPGTVCAVLQKGYLLDGKVLRHAAVKVVAEA